MLVRTDGAACCRDAPGPSPSYSDPAFAPEPFNDFYRQSLYHGYIGLTMPALEFIRQHLSEMASDVRPLAAKVVEQEPAILAKFKAIFEQRIYSLRNSLPWTACTSATLLVREKTMSLCSICEGDPIAAYQ